jgi:hypothetical protein
MIHPPIRSTIDERFDADLDEVADGMVGSMDALELVGLPDTRNPHSTDVEPREWAWYRESDAAEACIARFAGREADVSSADLDGLGRVSGVRFPRLGGVLHGKVAPGSVAAASLASAAERTIRAGYRAAIATEQVSAVPVLHIDFDELWDAFVPASYKIPRSVAATAWDVCRFDRFWATQLEDLGLDRDASRFEKGVVTPLSRSIRGLSTVGVALAVAERGGRHDRGRVSPRHAPRRRRHALHDLPPAPRLVVTS